jgi:hypothetical protein
MSWSLKCLFLWKCCLAFSLGPWVSKRIDPKN